MKIIRLAHEKFKKNPIPPIPLHQKGGLEEGRQREKVLIDAIKRMAEEWNIGPLGGNPHIDSSGNITMIQAMKNVIDYVNPNPIDEDLQAIAREYNGGYGPGLSSRWIRLNHFVWEKMLGDMGLLPRKSVTEEEFLKAIR